MTIRVVGLWDCTMCKTLRKALDKAGIAHDFSDCDTDPERCDDLEALTGATQYPMVLISELKNGSSEIVYIAKEYEQLKESVRSVGSTKLVAHHSIEGLLRYTVNRLYLDI